MLTFTNLGRHTQKVPFSLSLQVWVAPFASLLCRLPAIGIDSPNPMASSPLVCFRQKRHTQRAKRDLFVFACAKRLFLSMTCPANQRVGEGWRKPTDEPYKRRFGVGIE